MILLSYINFVTVDSSIFSFNILSVLISDIELIKNKIIYIASTPLINPYIIPPTSFICLITGILASKLAIAETNINPTLTSINNKIATANLITVVDIYAAFSSNIPSVLLITNSFIISLLLV